MFHMLPLLRRSNNQKSALWKNKAGVWVLEPKQLQVMKDQVQIYCSSLTLVISYVRNLHIVFDLAWWSGKEKFAADEWTFKYMDDDFQFVGVDVNVNDDVDVIDIGVGVNALFWISRPWW